MNEYKIETGIKFEFTTSYTYQQNSITEPDYVYYSGCNLVSNRRI